ncbi:MAG: acylphosphatase [Planctomycetota bacterium]|jgi:acylphosphatase
MIRYTVTFSGRVQGVGFRASARRVASSHRVSGWVRNEADGTVLMVAEGTGRELDRFVKSIEDAMGSCIQSTRISKEPAHGEFSGFSVRY